MLHRGASFLKILTATTSQISIWIGALLILSLTMNWCRWVVSLAFWLPFTSFDKFLFYQRLSLCFPCINILCCGDYLFCPFSHACYFLFWIWWGHYGGVNLRSTDTSVWIACPMSDTCRTLGHSDTWWTPIGRLLAMPRTLIEWTKKTYIWIIIIF